MGLIYIQEMLLLYLWVWNDSYYSNLFRIWAVIPKNPVRTWCIILSIGFNSHCPGIGKGKITAKKDLEKLVVDQFRQRSESVASEIQKLAAEGKIQKNAHVFRTFPGPKARICEAGPETR